MDRGNHDYWTMSLNRKVVVNPEVSEYIRGDVVYYNPSGYSKKNTEWNLTVNLIGRVVGLLGEKVEIKKGQVYIDGKKLEFFYSQPTVRGLYKDEYLQLKLKSSNMTSADFEENMDKITIPDNSIFVLGDQWWRSIDSRYLGTLSLDKVEGKVLGYCDI